jgi:tRNA 2-thiouridine synthesizing protein A
MHTDQEAPRDAAPEGLRAGTTIDTLGLYCPVPIIRTAEAIRRIAAGSVLEVVSDDRVILIDMPAWCRSMGHVYLGARHDAGAFHLFVRKAGGART